MRDFLIRLTVATLVMIPALSSIPAHAANDEFGPRFTQQAPAGLGDDSDVTPLLAHDDVSADNLNQIAPAAGDQPGDTNPTALELLQDSTTEPTPQIGIEWRPISR